ncbi:hypothetical protein KFL_015410010 [Klebsormidium nitens]|uniref:C3H1-type domain-containing protein n=1 Tax=Klebsormidium nitens TaxID=105231 RepID=A0A1Y1ITN8_KLENI|nr:hypothetical protein KFL_015410010 [Klebsormidium nitens]|eukprot:GAQ93452.1 hypothetical protein KFL_015410010 [Klebsormidium nitens]
MNELDAVLREDSGELPYFYTLPKVHKNPVKWRPVSATHRPHTCNNQLTSIPRFNSLMRLFTLPHQPLRLPPWRRNRLRLRRTLRRQLVPRLDRQHLLRRPYRDLLSDHRRNRRPGTVPDSRNGRNSGDRNRPTRGGTPRDITRARVRGPAPDNQNQWNNPRGRAPSGNAQFRGGPGPIRGGFFPQMNQRTTGPRAPYVRPSAPAPRNLTTLRQADMPIFTTVEGKLTELCVFTARNQPCTRTNCAYSHEPKDKRVCRHYWTKGLFCSDDAACLLGHHEALAAVKLQRSFRSMANQGAGGANVANQGGGNIQGGGATINGGGVGGAANGGVGGAASGNIAASGALAGNGRANDGSGNGDNDRNPFLIPLAPSPTQTYPPGNLTLAPPNGNGNTIPKTPSTKTSLPRSRPRLAPHSRARPRQARFPHPRPRPRS